MDLIDRPRYVDRALMFRDADLIKAVTGIRRCGQSSLLELVARRLAAEGVPEENLVKLNLESKSHNVASENDLYAYFKERMADSGKTYVFIDEIQQIKGWENAVNAMRVDFDCDIYVTGSNAYVLSSNLSTYISGRYVEIDMLPLSFDEYLSFCRVALPEKGPASSFVVDEKRRPYLVDDLLER